MPNYPYITELKEGDVLRVEGLLLPCLPEGSEHTVKRNVAGWYVDCADGIHWIQANYHGECYGFVKVDPGFQRDPAHLKSLTTGRP